MAAEETRILAGFCKILLGARFQAHPVLLLSNAGSQNGWKIAESFSIFNMGLPQCIIVTSLFSLFYVLVIVTGSYTKDEPLIWRCHSFLAVFSFRSLAASKRLLEKKYHKVCYNVNDSCMCWFIFVNACALWYTVYPLPMPQIRWGWKTSEMKNLKQKGTGWPIFQCICSTFVSVQCICDHFVIAEFVDLCSTINFGRRFQVPYFHGTSHPRLSLTLFLRSLQYTILYSI